MIARNIPLFIAFRVLFNARWYYPVIGVLFVDLGLTIGQYALLNVAWAISIVCLEVPSGALADQIGRRRMVVTAAVLMVVEMGLFAFAPPGAWLFPVLLLNRILSGAAEACASGADESLAYDSLCDLGREADWPAVLARMMRWQSAAFFCAMLVGALVYDHNLVTWLTSTLGWPTPASTVRWPLYLTLGNALVVLVVALALREPETGRMHGPTTVAATWRQTLTAARWIARTPVALFLIVAGLCMDSVIRLFLTLGSNYYRLIDLPAASYGVIGSAFAVLGFFTPKLAQSLASRRSLSANLLLTAGLSLAGLIGVALVLPKWGVLVILPIGVAMSLLQFFVSNSLNASVTDSSLRATVLSFKGLAFNLGYGALGLLFAAFTQIRSQNLAPDPVFIEALRWLPVLFALALGALVVWGYRLPTSQTNR